MDTSQFLHSCCTFVNLSFLHIPIGSFHDTAHLIDAFHTALCQLRLFLALRSLNPLCMYCVACDVYSFVALFSGTLRTIHLIAANRLYSRVEL